MSDLRNIVDRLDLLMDASSTTIGQPASRSQIDSIVTDLTERLGVLEGEVSELRTLVNHLMTIATWQAKVTATLVGDEAVADDGPYDEPTSAEVPRYGAPARQGTSEHQQQEANASGAAPHAPRTTTLDDDIDDILGTDRGPSARHAPPPDFGI